MSNIFAYFTLSSTSYTSSYFITDACFGKVKHLWLVLGTLNRILGLYFSQTDTKQLTRYLENIEHLPKHDTVKYPIEQI